MGSIRSEEPPRQYRSTLKRLGFYDEFALHPPGGAGSIRDAVRSAGDPDAAQIRAYLQSGSFVTAFADDEIDVIDRKTVIPDGASDMTDGTWVWGTDLPYYYQRYNLALPADFLAHVRSNNYVNPCHEIEDLTIDAVW